MNNQPPVESFVNLFREKPKPPTLEIIRKVQMKQKAKTCKDCHDYVYCPEANHRVKLRKQVCWLFE